MAKKRFEEQWLGQELQSQGKVKYRTAVEKQCRVEQGKAMAKKSGDSKGPVRNRKAATRQGFDQPWSSYVLLCRGKQEEEDKNNEQHL